MSRDGEGDPTWTDSGRSHGRRHKRQRSRAQVLVIFAMSALVFVGMCAVVVDVAWYWANTLRVQRAADAAALAGAVLLPGKVSTPASDNAYLRATKEAAKNGYTSGGGVVVTPIQNSLAVTGGNPRELDVTIRAPVSTFFMRLFGINSIDAVRTAKAEYILPVPMGSPQNYYGVGLFVAASESTGLKSGTPSAGVGWTNAGNADSNNNNVTASSNSGNGNWESWGSFGLRSAPNAFPVGAAVDGIEIQLRGNYTPAGNPRSNGCQLRVQLSWDGGTTWTPTSANTTITLSSGENLYSLGDVASTADWGSHTWTDTDLADSRFRIRLTFNKQSCSAGRSALVDTLQVNVSSQAGPRPVVDPTGATLAPQNFWGAMQSQGAPNIQGDAFMTKYQSRRDANNNTNLVPNGVDPAQDPDSFWDPVNYYNYIVEIPPRAVNGQVWIYDPGFCEVSTTQGTGENWTVGGDNGNASPRPVSAYYEVYDTRETLYDLTDDVQVGSSGTAFQDLTGDDSTLGGTNGSTSCTSASWHDHWWQLNTSPLSGGPEGTTYRVHTHTDAADQDNTTALNAFAIWATASGGTPRVYGSGAMEAYVRLPGGKASEFYLAQIAAVHAGKTMQIDLWDPGDTGNLSANLQILQPTATGYTPVSFSYTTSKGSTDPNVVNCPANGSGNSVTTNTGGTSLFNGCWLRISIVIPDSYTAPTPNVEPSGQAGWWKIRYTMGGSTTSYSTDLTTWKVQILGNPVHLIVP